MGRVGRFLRLTGWALATPWRLAWTTLAGAPVQLPVTMLARWPELAQARWRRGGLPPRVGGWCLGTRTVAAITLWDTIFLAPDTRFSPPLLLHELRHVHHYRASRLFPFRYVWQSLRCGYARNPFEADANAFASARLSGGDTLSQDV